MTKALMTQGRNPAMSPKPCVAVLVEDETHRLLLVREKMSQQKENGTS